VRLNARLGTGDRIVGLIRHDADKSGLDLDPAGMLCLCPALFDARFDDLEIVRVRVHAIAAGTIDLSQDPLVLGAPQVAVDQKLVARACRLSGFVWAILQVLADQAGDDRDLARLDDLIFDVAACPPQRAVEVSARTEHLLDDSDFPLAEIGQVSWRGSLSAAEHERPLILQEIALADRHIDAIDGELDDLPADNGNEG
jgi:hypothetical protein